MDPIRTITLPRRAPRASLVWRVLGRLALGRSRRRLGELDDHLLRDIGLTRGQARTEAERPVWDVPDHWLR